MRFFGVILLAAMLAACGFRPVHGPRTDGVPSALTGNVQIETGGGRDNQLLKIGLEDRFNPGGGTASANAAYALKVGLATDQIPMVIGTDGRIKRYSIQYRARYALVALSTGAEIFSGVAQRFGSYSVSDENFSSFMADRDTRERTLAELAQDIGMQVEARMDTLAVPAKSL